MSPQRPPAVVAGRTRAWPPGLTGGVEQTRSPRPGGQLGVKLQSQRTSHRVAWASARKTRGLAALAHRRGKIVRQTRGCICILTPRALDRCAQFVGAVWCHPSAGAAARLTSTTPIAFALGIPPGRAEQTSHRRASRNADSPVRAAPPIMVRAETQIGNHWGGRLTSARGATHCRPELPCRRN